MVYSMGGNYLIGASGQYYSIKLTLWEGGPQRGPGIAVMSTPIPCLPRPTSGHFSGNPVTTHPRTA